MFISFGESMAKLRSSKTAIVAVSDIASKYQTYAAARTAARQLGACSREEYFEIFEIDFRLYKCPDSVFRKKGWKGWSDYLGLVPRIRRRHSYVKAQRAVKKLKIRSQDDYSLKWVFDPLLPGNPAQHYGRTGQWQGWRHFLGKELIDHYSFRKLREMVLASGCEHMGHYFILRQKDPRMPAYPWSFYKDFGWKGTDYFFNRPKKVIIPYEQAVAIVRLYQVTNKDDYFALAMSEPQLGLPRNPHLYYKNIGWKGWMELWGKSVRAEKKKAYYPSWKEAGQAALKVGIVSSRGYVKSRSKDSRLPKNPKQYYVDWPGPDKFFGREKKYTYEEASLSARKLGWKFGWQYKAGYKVDPRFPCRPDVVYKGKGWKGWKQFFGVKLYTIGELTQLLRLKGIVSRVIYFKLAMSDPRISVVPAKDYGKVWPGWSNIFRTHNAQGAKKAHRW